MAAHISSFLWCVLRTVPTKSDYTKVLWRSKHYFRLHIHCDYYGIPVAIGIRVTPVCRVNCNGNSWIGALPNKQNNNHKCTSTLSIGYALCDCNDAEETHKKSDKIIRMFRRISTSSVCFPSGPVNHGMERRTATTIKISHEIFIWMNLRFMSVWSASLVPLVCQLEFDESDAVFVLTQEHLLCVFGARIVRRHKFELRMHKRVVAVKIKGPGAGDVGCKSAVCLWKTKCKPIECRKLDAMWPGSADIYSITNDQIHTHSVAEIRTFLIKFRVTAGCDWKIIWKPVEPKRNFSMSTDKNLRKLLGVKLEEVNVQALCFSSSLSNLCLLNEARATAGV